MNMSLENQHIRNQIEKAILVNVDVKEIDLLVLYKCRKLLAEIIQKYGHYYLPLFLCLEEEIEKQEQQTKALNRALQMNVNQS